MSETETRLDDKYKSGIWYDTQSGDFCKIQEGIDNYGDIVIELVNPETESVYHEISLHNWPRERLDFVEIHEQAVEDPVDFYRATVENLVEASQYGGKQLPFSEEISFRYAKQQVKITES